MLDLSVLNPKGKYPRRYMPGYFSKLMLRHGRRTSRKWRNEIRFVLSSFFANKTVEKIFTSVPAHWAFPLAIGVLVGITGNSAMVIRSAVLILCASWLSVEIGIKIAATKWREYWKSWIFVVCCNILFCSAMYGMKSFLSSTLADQRDDVYQHLSGEMSIPSTGNVYASQIEVTNRAATTIGRKAIACYVRELHLKNDQHDVTMKYFGEISTPYGPQSFIVPPVGPLNLDAFMDSIPLAAGGGAQTDLCLPLVRITNVPVTCADIEVFVAYQLQTQLGIDQMKFFRFVIKTSDDAQKWLKEPPEYNGSYCQQGPAS